MSKNGIYLCIQKKEIVLTIKRLKIMETTNTTIKATGKSTSGKTYYFYIPVAAGSVTVKEGLFCGSCEKEEATLEEISWSYVFGKKTFSITNNGKNKLVDYADIMVESYAKIIK